MNPAPFRPAERAFSLLELLVVIGIIALVASFVIPAASTMVRGTALNQGAQQITDRLSYARQSAITKNRPIEVRFLRYGAREVPGEDPTNAATGYYRAIQLLEVFDTGLTVSLDKIHALPQSVVMDAAGLSTILPGSTTVTIPLPVQSPTNNDVPLPGSVAGRTPIASQYQYVAFRFLPNGSTSLSPTGSWYVTLKVLKSPQDSPTIPPANFFTLQIDPVSGSMKGFRPAL